MFRIILPFWTSLYDKGFQRYDCIYPPNFFQVICTRNEGAREPANVFNKFTMTNSYEHPDCTELGGRKYTSMLFATHMPTHVPYAYEREPHYLCGWPFGGLSVTTANSHLQSPIRNEYIAWGRYSKIYPGKFASLDHAWIFKWFHANVKSVFHYFLVTQIADRSQTSTCIWWIT